MSIGRRKYIKVYYFSISYRVIVSEAGSFIDKENG